MVGASHGVLANCRVLVAEDESFIARDISRALRALSAEVIGPVPSRRDVQAILSTEEHIDAAILDINLGGEMVFAVLNALATRNIPVVFATGYDQDVIPLEYQHIPRWQKPFEASALAEVLPTIVRPRPGVFV